MYVGSVVRSKCGRDRKRVFVIVGELPENSESTYVLVADGGLHSLQNPKKKNIRHLAVLAAAPDGETSFFKDGDSGLRQFIADFESGMNKKS